MWIKRALVILPVLLFVFLAQSVFWVPGAASVANNEGRQNRIILYMGGNPEDMNPWTSTKTTDSTISDYFFEGLLKYNRMYEIEPWLADTCVVRHEVTAVVPNGMTAAEFEASVRAEFGEAVELVAAGPELEGKMSEDQRKELKDSPLLPELERLYKDLPKLATIKISFGTAGVKGKIVSAVQPDFQERIEKRLQKELLGSHLGDYMAGLESLPKDLRDKLGLTPDKYKEQIFAKLSELGMTACSHAPIVDAILHKDVYWTDGPFFSSPAETWQVTVNGDEAGVVVAASAQAAADIIRTRLDLVASDKVEAGQFEKRFGDEVKGPWWGRGPELAARDIKITYDHIRSADFGSPRRSSYTSIVDIRTFKENKHRVQVVYSELYSPALSDLVGSILPYHRWNLVAWAEEAARRGLSAKDLGLDKSKYSPVRALRSRDREFALAPSYLGAMLLDPMNGASKPYWQNNLRVRLRRNEFYWNRMTEYQYVDWFVFDPALGSETSEVVFLGGGMDLYSAKDYQVQRYEQMDDRYYVIKKQPTTYEYFGFNMTREILKDKRVRLALSMAINVDEIIKYVCFDQGTRTNGPAYPVLPWYNTEYRFEHTWRTGPKKGQVEKLQFVPFDMEEAKALLVEAGCTLQGGKLYKDGQPLKIQFVNSTSPGPRAKSAVLAKERWEQLGLEVDYKTYEWNDYIQRFVMAMNFDICVLGWSGGLDFDSRQLWKSTSRPPEGLNFVGYDSKQADKLMEDILKVYDPTQQVRMSHEIFKTIAEDFPYVFLYSPFTTTIVDRHIVWRKEIGRDAAGKPIYEDRPLDHEYIKSSRATWRYFEPELVRRAEIPLFDEDKRKN